MNFLPTPLPGAWLIESNSSRDDRGYFVKPYHRDEFLAHGISFQPVEQFYSESRQGVLRGMHFQTPPAAHDKLVYCLRGRILDVLLDLRKNSPAFGQSWSVEFDGASFRSVFVPAGVAHGFLSLTPDSLVMYSVTTVHNAACDLGIRWDSFGFAWPVKSPVLSSRDASFPPLKDFSSPF